MRKARRFVKSYQKNGMTMQRQMTLSLPQIMLQNKLQMVCKLIVKSKNTYNASERYAFISINFVKGFLKMSLALQLSKTQALNCISELFQFLICLHPRGGQSFKMRVFIPQNTENGFRGGHWIWCAVTGLNFRARSFSLVSWVQS